ncbi:MoxR family ATPase [Deltaproteobacteria bacterium PRO3]|nr:MoxR family ATPase [Deltaproteobacteria bacterium PRO3]
MQHEIQQNLERVKAYQPVLSSLLEEISKVVVGQRYMVERLLMGILLEGHILVEGVPGLAKTTTVRALAKVLDVRFQRIQFTPDLLPADLIGTQIFNPKTQEFTVKQGPIFANVILADEINRAPAKVQSALLEAMQEKQVTIGNNTFPLEPPFVVLATQNPIEQEGTYPLPEAQVDRFMLKLNVSYPSKEEEIAIMDRARSGHWEEVAAKVSHKELGEMRRLIAQIYLDPKIKDYIVRIVMATRHPAELKLGLESYIQFGASPRASIYLAEVARCYAFLQGRAFVTPQDVKTMAHDVLRHRILLTYMAEAEGLSSDEVLKKILDQLEVP